MLRCRDVADLTSDYVNGDLPRGIRVAVALHLMMCRLCRRYLRQIRETLRLLRGMREKDTGGYEGSARELFRSTRRR